MSKNVKYANIMLLGKTGVGKSSFINYLVGQEVCKTGTGKPVTQEFHEYINDDIDGIPLRIYDSKGLEIQAYAQIEEDIRKFIKAQSKSDNFFDWIHSIFYCINLESRRVESEEIDFINRMSEATAQAIHIIITHCEKTADGIQQSNAMKQHILSCLKSENVKVYCVNSKETRTRIETHEAFGREEILDQVFSLLWADIADKISSEYAVEFTRELESVHRKIKISCAAAVERLGGFSIISDLINDREDYLTGFENEFENIERSLNDMEKNLNTSYRKKIQPLVEFCNGYGKSMRYSVELINPFDFISESFIDFEFDDIFEKSKIMSEIEELDDVDTDSFFDAVRALFKSVGLIFRIKGLFEKILDSFCEELWNSFPGEERIKELVYNRLLNEVSSSK